MDSACDGSNSLDEASVVGGKGHKGERRCLVRKFIVTVDGGSAFWIREAAGVSVWHTLGTVVAGQTACIWIGSCGDLCERDDHVHQLIHVDEGVDPGHCLGNIVHVGLCSRCAVEGLVHYALHYSRTSGQAEWHAEELVQPILGDEGGLVDVVGMYGDCHEGHFDVHEAEEFSHVHNKAVKDVIDMGRGAVLPYSLLV